MSGVLFVCTGNQCRSPLAEAKFKAMMEEYGLTGWQIESAGTWIENGFPGDKRALAWAEKEGLNIRNHTTQRVNGKLLNQHDLIVVMEKGHQEALRSNYPNLNGKIMGLSELSGPFYDIPDPVSLPDEEFEEISKEVVNLVKKGFNEIVNRLMKTQNSQEKKTFPSL
ncbi:MAG: hypothetical protein JW757_09775 [Anaerolineales bacterium]|nr:hypothetical protein [Anaerolineales bacterium]